MTRSKKKSQTAKDEIDRYEVEDLTGFMLDVEHNLTTGEFTYQSTGRPGPSTLVDRREWRVDIGAGIVTIRAVAENGELAEPIAVFVDWLNAEYRAEQVVREHTAALTVE